MSPAYDQMSPDASPGMVPAKAGVRRVNNLPIIIGVALMGIFVLVMALVAYDRAQKQNRPVPEVKEEEGGNTTAFVKELTANQHDGGIIEPSITPQPPALPPAIEGGTPPAGPAAPDRPASSPVGILRPAPTDDLELPPVPPRPGQALQRPSGPRDDEIERMRIDKLRQLEEAMKAKTTVSAVAPRSAGSVTSTAAPVTRDEQLARLAAIRQQIEANTRDDPTAAYKARLAQLQGVGGGGGGAQLLQTQNTTNNNIGQFANPGSEDRWKLTAEPEPPRSAYELRAGFVLPATLISGINSELPGQIIGQVAQNVYDTATGKHLLIPQGARLVGAYSSSVAYGQARVLIAWQRIVFPDGKAIDIGSMPGADSAGYAGFTDQVNNHYFRIFSSALLMSAVTAGIALSQPQQIGNNSQTAQSAMSEALGQQLGQVTAQLIAKNMSIAPTLEIRPGYRFNVMVTKDLTFTKPYRAFDYRLGE